MEYGSSRPHGHWLVDGKEVADTLQCVHCGDHFVVVFGSGKRRGFCMNCNGTTCGKPGCHACIPFEKKLDLYEAGKISTLDANELR